MGMPPSPQVRGGSISTFLCEVATPPPLSEVRQGCHPQLLKRRIANSTHMYLAFLCLYLHIYIYIYIYNIRLTFSGEVGMPASAWVGWRCHLLIRCDGAALCWMGMSPPPYVRCGRHLCLKWDGNAALTLGETGMITISNETGMSPRTPYEAQYITIHKYM